MRLRTASVRSPSSVGSLVFLLLTTLFLAEGEAWAQLRADEAPAVLSGFVTDATDDQPLVGANVALQQLADSTLFYGRATDRDGLYLLSDLPPGRYEMRVTFVGYVPHVDTLRLTSGERRTVNVPLAPSETALEKVLVEEEREGAADLTAGQQTIQPTEIQRIPTPDASGDLASYLTTLPSVVTVADRGGQLFVRGGEPSQNLMLLDGMVLYQPFHMLGFYSAFPSGIINHTDLYAGGFGAKYGRRLSSVIDVSARTGNKQQFSGSLSLSPFMGEARLEGPILSDRISGLASVRRSMLENGAEPLLGQDLPFSFGDAFAKVHTEPTQNSRLSVSAIRTYDRGTLPSSSGAEVLQNDTPSEDPFPEVRWRNWGVGGRYLSMPSLLPVVADLHVTFSGIRTELGPRDSPTRTSRVRTTRIAFDATFPDDRATFRTGFRGSFTRFAHSLDGLYQDTITDSLTTLDHIVMYLEPEIEVGGGLQVRPGLRLQFLQSRFNPFLVPRLRATWERGIHQVSAAGGLYYQETVGLSDRRDASSVFTAWTNIPKHTNLFPRDVRRGRTPRAIHGVLGYQVGLAAGVELSLEGYYKHLSDLFIAEWTAFPRFTTRLQTADGRSFGTEVRLEAQRGAFYGYLGYGYSNTVYQAKQSQLELWYGTERLRFRPPHDRRHQVNALANVEIAGFDVSLRWTLGSGRPYNRIVGFDGFVPIDAIEDAKDVAGDRRVIYDRPFDGVLPPYHRLDVSVERAFSLGSGVELVAQATVLNAYDRRNIFYLDTFTLERVDQLPITPSVGLALHYR